MSKHLKVGSDQIRKEVKRLLGVGWTLSHGKHLCISAPGGHKLPIPGSPGDVRSSQNWLSALKRLERSISQQIALTPNRY